jgi:2-methylcitrate dehydratase PrpD
VLGRRLSLADAMCGIKEFGRDDADASEAFVRFALKLRFHDLPPQVVAQTKHAIIDTVGVALAGAALGEGAREVMAYAAMLGGAPAASIWSNGQRTTPVSAALVNGVLARVLDFDDIIDHPQVHIATCVLPAAMAMSESRRQPLSGAQFLAAVAAGAELQARLAAAIASNLHGQSFPKLQPTQIFGYFSAALAAGLLLELAPDKLRDALGLALMQCAGTQELVVHSAASVGKGIYSGFSAQAGVQAALMASSGVTARGRIFEGRAGLFAAHYGGQYDRDALVGGFGARFYSARRCFKMQPGTLVAHAFVEAALAAKAELGLASADIEAVEIRVGPWGQAMCEPVQMRRRPETSSAAMNNIPFCVAKALVNGSVELADFEAGGRDQPEALAMVDRIIHTVDPALAVAGGLEPGIVALRAVDGRIGRIRVDLPRGHHQRPASAAEIIDKFRRNLAHAGNPPIDADAFIARIDGLEHETDVRDLISRLWMAQHHDL